MSIKHWSAAAAVAMAACVIDRQESAAAAPSKRIFNAAAADAGLAMRALVATRALALVLHTHSAAATGGVAVQLTKGAHSSISVAWGAGLACHWLGGGVTQSVCHWATVAGPRDIEARHTPGLAAIAGC